MALSSMQKKNFLRAGIASIYIVGMLLLYGSKQDVVWWFWMWPLTIAIIFYNLILWFGRCPTCREEFALEPGDRGLLFTTFTCNRCGAQCKRISGGNAGGGGGP